MSKNDDVDDDVKRKSPNTHTRMHKHKHTTHKMIVKKYIVLRQCQLRQALGHRRGEKKRYEKWRRKTAIFTTINSDKKIRGIKRSTNKCNEVRLKQACLSIGVYGYTYVWRKKNAAPMSSVRTTHLNYADTQNLLHRQGETEGEKGAREREADRDGVKQDFFNWIIYEFRVIKIELIAIFYTQNHHTDTTQRKGPWICQMS